MTDDANDRQRLQRIADAADGARHLADQLRGVEHAIGRFLSECNQFETHAAEIGFRLTTVSSLGTFWQPKIGVERSGDDDLGQRPEIIQALLICIDWRQKTREWNSNSVRTDVVSKDGEVLQTVGLRERYPGPIA